ncbi:MAG: conjugal transfer protein TraX [Clostridia bacterium]|nr:conjugal transfer protein TraX [Clostridia bacterium]
MEKNQKIEITSFALHILAMILMLCDHLWGTIIPGNEWLTCIGRIAFPIFAFLLVEGYFHTKNLKKYVQRLFIFALISEIPFNLMKGSSITYILAQNVLWTFLIGIWMIYLNEKVKSKKIFIKILVALATTFLGYLLGFITFADYYGYGVLMILTFYFFRGNKIWNYIAQFIAMIYINVNLMKGLSYEVNLFNKIYFIPQQAYALIALIPIWLYQGKQGPYNKIIKYVYYAFYPIHILILGLLKVLI